MCFPSKVLGHARPDKAYSSAPFETFVPPMPALNCGPENLVLARFFNNGFEHSPLGQFFITR